MQHHRPDDFSPAANMDLNKHASTRRESVRSVAEMLPIYARLEAWMRVYHYRRKDVFAVKLALGEALLNAVHHGNQGDWLKGIEVRYVVTADEVIVEVEDAGEGFDSTQILYPSTPELQKRFTRRGLFLMRTYMTGVNFNLRGNRVTMYRQRTVK